MTSHESIISVATRFNSKFYYYARVLTNQSLAPTNLNGAALVPRISVLETWFPFHDSVMDYNHDRKDIDICLYALPSSYSTPLDIGGDNRIIGGHLPMASAWREVVFLKIWGVGEFPPRGA
jgi:hypothetical protein